MGNLVEGFGGKYGAPFAELLVRAKTGAIGFGVASAIQLMAVVMVVTVLVGFGLKYTMVKNLMQAPLIDQENARSEKRHQTNMPIEVFQNGAKLGILIGLQDQKRWDCVMVCG